MREIKFRAWDGEQMIYLPLAGLQYFDFEGSYALSFVVDGYGGFWAHEQYDTMSEKASKFPIMQFTGLKDKNGKEIYEGDIVTDYSDFKGEIVFQTGCFMIEWRGQDVNNELAGIVDFRRGTPRTDIEAIGNIYENPELLTSPPKN